MTLLTPVSDRESEMLARTALDQHWAVAAIPMDRRALLLDRVEQADPVTGASLGDPIAESLTMLATAYEIASLGQLEVVTQESGAEARRLARNVLALGAARAFRVYSAIELPQGDLELAVRAITRLAALAVVGRQREAFARLATRPDIVALLEAAEREATAEWNATEQATRLTVWLCWLALLRRPDREGLATLIDRLGMLRERRGAVTPTRVDPREPASVLRARFQHFVLRQSAEAAEELAAALHRRTVPDISAKLSLHFGAARSAATGDHGLDLLLAWLHGASVMIAGGVTDQLELPGM